MKRVLFLVIPAIIYAHGLKELIEFATMKNDLILSKELSKDVKSEELKSKKSAYFPTIDIGGFYKRDDKASPFQAGDIYSGYAKVGYDIYDGGKRSSTIKSAKDELISANFESDAMKKNIALSIVKDFYTIKSLQSSLEAQEEAQKSLKAQLERVKQFYEVKIVTKDDVDRLQSSYDTNIYNIEELKFQILTLTKSLELESGVTIDSLDDSVLVKEMDSKYDKLDDIKALISKKNSLLNGAKGVDSLYLPNVKIEDTYSLYGYNREDSRVTPLDNQNVLMLSVNMRVFDNARVAKAKEAILINSKAINAQINYKNKEQKIQYELSSQRIETTKQKIQSSSSALVAASSAFNTIEKKYNAGIVDYVIYLDALTKKTTAKALYESSLNDLEVAYAIYYFYAGKKIEEYIK